MDPVETYCGLDLGKLRSELLQGVSEEAKQQQIELSGSHDRAAPSQGITPHAVQWFNANIASLRSSALSQVANEAREIRLDGDAFGICAPLELDEVERKRARRLMEVTEEFRQRNSSVMSEYQDKDQTYRRLRSGEGGREAKVPSSWVEFFGLLPLVMLPEALMNFQSFRKAPMIGSDFMALGVTLLVAIGIAVAAHFFGLFLRHYNYYRRGDDLVRGRSGMPRLWISSVLLLTCLVVVGAARYYYILPQIQQAVVLGMSPPNIYFSVLSLLGGNVLCFLIGAAFAWTMHDENPEYEDAARALGKARKQLEKAKRKQLDGRVDEINRRLASDRTAVERQLKVTGLQPGYGRVVQFFEQIKGKDQQVISLLQEYRKNLGQTLLQERPKFQFGLKDYSGDPLQITRALDVAEYMNQSIHLHYSRS